MNTSIRVLIVDDQPVIRSGLTTLLQVQSDLDLVGEASDGDEARTLCNHLKPDVVLMDLVMPNVDGIEAIRAIRKLCAETRIIVLTSFSDEELIHKALEAGATSYILKTVTGEELANAIRESYMGRSILAPEAAQVLIRATTGPKPLGHDLTEREHEVLELLAAGMSNAAIADALVISVATAKFHVSNVLSKLGVRTRTEAVSVAYQQHLLTE
ncbi:MAG: response regulator [Anaerolineae bacterium]